MRHVGYTLLGAVVLFVGGFILLAVLVLLLGLFGYIHDNPICLAYAALAVASVALFWFVGKAATPICKTLFW